MDELCLVCFNEFPKQNIYKYHCSTCKNIICDACYDEHIKISTKCVFCRGELLLPQKRFYHDINENDIHVEVFNKTTTYCWFACISSSFMFLIITIFVPKAYEETTLLNATVFPE